MNDMNTAQLEIHIQHAIKNIWGHSRDEIHINGYEIFIKAVRLSQKKHPKWAYRLKGKANRANYVLLIGLQDGAIQRMFLIPVTLLLGRSIVQIPPDPSNKWWKYSVNKERTLELLSEPKHPKTTWISGLVPKEYQ